ncbi:MAG: 3-dehydroquinate synthase family protein [Eubacteriales bacterium]
MNEIKIQSRLYDYSVEFIQGFAQGMSGLGAKVAYVIDRNVYELHHHRFATLQQEHIYYITPKEQYKNMDTVMELIGYWKEIGLQKDWNVVCIGGGITQDVTATASYLYLRNINWYFFPSTLLAMCDSCIGGKSAINLGEYKNQIGVFYPPKRVFIDQGFLRTLPRADWINGWGELLKFSLTQDRLFYEELKEEKEYILCPNIEQYIGRGLEVKRNIIEQDEFESDLRRILNYGHTFGHALEAYTYNKIPHGTAVMWGIDVVNYIAWKKGLLSKELYLDVKSLIKTSFLNEEIVVDNPKQIYEIIKTDKKVKSNVLNFALLDEEKGLLVVPISLDDELEKLFLRYIEDTTNYYLNQ